MKILQSFESLPLVKYGREFGRIRATRYSAWNQFGGLYYDIDIIKNGCRTGERLLNVPHDEVTFCEAEPDDDKVVAFSCNGWAQRK